MDDLPQGRGISTPPGPSTGDGMMTLCWALAALRWNAGLTSVSQ
jgi:hypothetical protein